MKSFTILKAGRIFMLSGVSSDTATIKNEIEAGRHMKDINSRPRKVPIHTSLTEIMDSREAAMYRLYNWEIVHEDLPT